MISGSDSYIPGRYPPPRRRSRSGGSHYRRDRSRERESPRRRERTRTPPRRSPPRRSLSRRRSPPRDDRYDRPRSPRRDWDRDRDRDRDWERDRIRDRERDLNRERDRGRMERDPRDREWERDRDRDRVPDRDRDFDRRDDRQAAPFMVRELNLTSHRRRSRSPFNRRERTPPGRATPLGSRGGSYRPRSPSPGRRDDRYQSYRRPSPPKESAISSAINSQSASGRSSPRANSMRARSPRQSRDNTPQLPGVGAAAVARDSARPSHESTTPTPATKSPPRGPAALRAPPTGPAANRSFSTSAATPTTPSSRPLPTPTTAPHRSEPVSPPHAPAGPRGYVGPSRGSFSSRGGRGSWTQAPQRHVSGPSSTPSTPGGQAPIPTGPRGTPVASTSSTASSQPRPFNPPTGPSSQHGGAPRQTLAQSMLATLPPLIPGGKLDPSMAPLATGVTKDIEPHYKKLKDEEEKIREELRAKQERLRKSLYAWNRLERDARAWEMRSDLSEKSMTNLAGEGMGGAAF
ncbi:hypothetical protein HJFPF1_07912 [Paramyrothecium foliicola]|nr:hypothetical protein HJFPF1_07912 [Paramyrothecium foliicola]